MVAVTEILRENYRHIRNCYKYYSSVGIASDVWGISNNSWTEFINQCGIIDGKTFNLAGSDLQFNISNYPGDRKDVYNPKASLVRFNFLEIIVRIGIVKYKDSGITDSFSSAIQFMMDQITPYLKTPLFDSQIWREESLWKERPDMTLKKFKPLLEWFFAKYSGMKTLPGKKKFMCLDEFKNLCADGGIFEGESMLAEREVPICYAISMMTQIDELNQSKVFEMGFLEFLEAFSRVADKANLVPIQTPEEQVGSVSKSWREKGLPLWAKIESAIARVANGAIPFGQRKRMNLPTTAMYDDLVIQFD